MKMKDAKFTPGPWNRSQYGYQVLTRDSENSICELKGAKNMAEQIANASIIAAAPDMYEALEKANSFISNGIKLGYIKMPDLECEDTAWETPEIICKALTKARGEISEKEDDSHGQAQ